MTNKAPLRIVADENMPGVAEWFSPFGEVTLLPGREISAVQLAEADVLLVRSVTKVNRDLLTDSPVKFVGSATIGVDHVDTAYLVSQSIHFCHAPGCNARAVVEYVLSCLAALQPGWQASTVGIIGCGNVGGQLLHQLASLGVVCKGYDPFLEASSKLPLTDLDEVLQCDVISVHTPLTTGGKFPSFHLLNQDRLAQIKEGALLINAGRGAVIDGRALLDHLKRQQFRCVLDVWENEPDICLELLDAVDVATPHIAGYSLDGKVNGTRMVFDGFLNWLGEETANPSLNDLETQRELMPGTVDEVILQAYDVRQDSTRFRTAMTAREKEPVAVIFDKYRKEYPHRLEFSHYHVALGQEGTLTAKEQQCISALGLGEGSAH